MLQLGYPHYAPRVRKSKLNLLLMLWKKTLTKEKDVIIIEEFWPIILGKNRIIWSKDQRT